MFTVNDAEFLQGEYLEFTGEQIVPDKMAFDPRELQAHLGRYTWALQFVPNLSVLDAACGTGYGTMILSWVASEAVGIDKKLTCIFYAKRWFSAPRTRFIQGDLLEPFGTSRYDVIVSFETVEHLEDPIRFVHNAYRALKRDGLLIISAPENSGSSWHVKDYTQQELRSLLAEVFSPYEMQFARYVTQGPTLQFVEEGEPLWEHPTHIYLVRKYDAD